MFVNDRDRHVLLAPPSPVERGPEVGAPPIRVGDRYVLVYCPANAGPARRWGVGALLLDAGRRRVVDDVAFPSGAVYLPEHDEVRVYYGGGDRASFLAYGRMSELVDALSAAPAPVRDWPY